MGFPRGRRRRDDAPPPPYRRRSVSTFSPEDVERHKERIVEVAMAAGKRAPTQSNAQELGLRIGDDVEHPSFGEGVIIDIKGTGEKATSPIKVPLGTTLALYTEQVVDGSPLALRFVLGEATQKPVHRVHIERALARSHHVRGKRLGREPVAAG